MNETSLKCVYYVEYGQIVSEKKNRKGESVFILNKYKNIKGILSYYVGVILLPFSF